MQLSRRTAPLTQTHAVAASRISSILIWFARKLTHIALQQHTPWQREWHKKNKREQNSCQRRRGWDEDDNNNNRGRRSRGWKCVCSCSWLTLLHWGWRISPTCSFWPCSGRAAFIYHSLETCIVVRVRRMRRALNDWLQSAYLSAVIACAYISLHGDYAFTASSEIRTE